MSKPAIATDITALELKLTIRAAVIAMAVATALFGALHLWPPVAPPAPPPPHANAASIVLAAEQTAAPPYSCRLYYDEQKKCAFGSCDQRTLDRLKKECLRDGGRP